MNSLGLATSRISCLNTRTIFQKCHEVDSFAARLLRSASQSCSKPVLNLPRKNSLSLARDLGRRPRRGPSAPSAGWLSARTYASKRIITRFEELPLNYTDEKGIPFREIPLSKEEVSNIFGNIVDVTKGNEIMRILHGRRVAGTLEDPSLASPGPWTVVERHGLAWLRENVPVDEVESAGLRAEHELATMDAQIISDAERIGIYKSTPKFYKTDSSKKMSPSKGREAWAPNSEPRRDVYGQGAFDKIRKANERKWEEEKAAEEEARRKQADEVVENAGMLETTSARSQVELRRPGENPWLKYYLKRAQFLPEKPPEMTSFQRIWPSALCVLAVVLTSLVFSEVYQPPKLSDRLWPEIPPSAATISGLIAMNIAVFALWRFPPALRMLNKNFLWYPGYPRPIALLGSMFSHQTISHLAGNMVVLYFVGVRLHEDIGRANFLAVYLSAGIVGGLLSHMHWTFMKVFISSSLGASGGVCGIIACYLLLHGSEKVTAFGVFPPENWPSLSALMFLVLLVSVDGWGIRKGFTGEAVAKLKVDHWVHMGGYLTGAAAVPLLKSRINRRREARRKEGRMRVS